MQHTGLAVVESRWWSEGNDSVRPLFEILAGIVNSNPHSIRYYMFVEENSLNNIVSDIANDYTFHSVYIGAHGGEGSITGLGNNEISRTKLRNILARNNVKGTISGLYFGSCLIANFSSAEFLLHNKDIDKDTRLKWIAGFANEVDWIDSSAIDMIFWSKYIQERMRNKRKKKKKSDTDMIVDTPADIKSIIPSAFDKFGFNVLS